MIFLNSSVALKSSDRGYVSVKSSFICVLATNVKVAEQNQPQTERQNIKIQNQNIE